MNSHKLAYGAITSFAMNATKSVLVFLMLPIMAKLVGPDQYGLYSTAIPAVMFAMVISDAGLGMSLARETNDDSPVWSSALVALLSFSILLSAIIIIYSWVIAKFTGDARLLPITAVSTLSLLFSAMCVVPSARLTRGSELTSLAVIDFGAFLFGAGGAIILALLQFGIWALVSQLIITTFFRFAFLTIRMPTRIRLSFSFSMLKPHLAIGSALGICRLSDLVARMAEVLIIGRGGSTALNGAFGFGTQVSRFAVELVNNQVWNVTYIMALHTTGEDLKQNYLRLTRICAIAVIPISGLIMLTARDVLGLVMGQEWTQAAILIEVMAPAYAISCVSSIGSAAMFARGLSGDPLRLSFELMVLRIIAVSSLPFFGWEVMVQALAVVHLVNASHGFLYIERRFKWGIGSLLLWLLKPITATAIAAFGVFWLFSGPPASLASLAQGALFGVLIYSGILFLLDYRQLLNDIESFNELMRSRNQPHT